MPPSQRTSVTASPGAGSHAGIASAGASPVTEQKSGAKTEPKFSWDWLPTALGWAGGVVIGLYVIGTACSTYRFMSKPSNPHYLKHRPQPYFGDGAKSVTTPSSPPPVIQSEELRKLFESGAPVIIPDEKAPDSSVPKTAPSTRAPALPRKQAYLPGITASFTL